MNSKVAVRVPDVVGAKAIEAVQVAEAARVEPQVLLVIWKSPGFAPERAMLLMVRVEAPPFVSVTAFDPPRLPTATYTQLRLVGDTDALPEAAAPVPARATVCGLLVALSVKVSIALREPVALGVNAMLAVQLADAARLVPQVLLEIEKSAAFVPEIATLLMVIEVERPLVSVADCVALVDPTVVLENVRLVGLFETLPLGLVPKPVSVMV